MEEMEANIGGGQTLAVPGLFIYEKDSEDHLDSEEEGDETGEQEDNKDNPAGDQQPQQNSTETLAPPQ